MDENNKTLNYFELQAMQNLEENEPDNKESEELEKFLMSESLPEDCTPQSVDDCKNISYSDIKQKPFNELSAEEYLILQKEEEERKRKEMNESLNKYSSKTDKLLGIGIASMALVLIVIIIANNALNSSYESSYTTTRQTVANRYTTTAKTSSTGWKPNPDATKLTTSSDGYDWLAATNEQKLDWCNDTISSWEIMNGDVYFSAKDLSGMLDEYYSDYEFLPDSLVDTCLLFADVLGVFN